jgi:hypothetical protein
MEVAIVGVVLMESRFDTGYRDNEAAAHRGCYGCELLAAIVAVKQLKRPLLLLFVFNILIDGKDVARS